MLVEGHIVIYGPYIRKEDNRKFIHIRNRKTGKDRTVLYARYLLESYLGRRLKPGHEADHINCDCTDDRIENLQELPKRKNQGKWRTNYGGDFSE